MSSKPPKSDSQHKLHTRERLLDIAEQLFAERGFASTSVREITDAAGANLAAVNYHFQSKENLYAEVFLRRIAHLREQFLARLRDDKTVADGDLEPALDAIANAFMSPHAEPEYGRRFLDLCSREFIEARLPAGLFLREFVTPLIEKIVGIVERVRPDLDEETVRGCAHSFLAQLLHVVKGVRLAASPPGAGIVIPPVGDQLARAVRFTAAAIRHI